MPDYSVDVIVSTGQVVEILVPATPKVIEVVTGVPGPQGPPGPGGGGGGPRMVTISVPGLVSVGTVPVKVYNDTGTAWTISAIRANLASASSGGSTTVDVNVNDVTVFSTQSRRPVVTANSTTSGKVTNPNVTSVPDGSYLSIDVDGAPGSPSAAGLSVAITVV